MDKSRRAWRSRKTLGLALLVPWLLGAGLVDPVTGTPGDDSRPGRGEAPDIEAPRAPLYPHPDRERLYEAPKAGMENRRFDLPPSAPQPEGSADPDHPVRPMTPVAPAR